MRKAHLLAGIIAVTAFLVTGQIMAHRTPPMATLGADVRLLFRSRHIYILAAGLVNLMLGLYMQPQTGWRGVGRSIGSGLVVLSPAMLIIAFAIEPRRGFQEEMRWSAAGLYALFGGSVAHLASWISEAPAEGKTKARVA
jgi:hypothetical protein